MNPVSVFLEELGNTMPPLKKLQEAVKVNVIHSFKSQSVQEMYEKWRRNLCEWCDECFGENGYFGHECKEMGHGDFIFISNEGRDDELLALVKPMYKPPLYQQNSVYPSIPMTKKPPNQKPSESCTNQLNHPNFTTLTPSTLSTKCIEDTMCEDFGVNEKIEDTMCEDSGVNEKIEDNICEDSGVNEEIEGKVDLKLKEDIKDKCEELITVHKENVKYKEKYPIGVEKEKIDVSIMGKKLLQKNKERGSNKSRMNFEKKENKESKRRKKKTQDRVNQENKRREKKKKVRNSNSKAKKYMGTWGGRKIKRIRRTLRRDSIRLKIQEKSKYTGRIFDAQVCSGSGGGPGRWGRNKGKSVAAAADKVEYIGRLIGKLRRLAGDGGIEVGIFWWVVAGERWTVRKKDADLFEVFEHGKKREEAKAAVTGSLLNLPENRGRWPAA